jgi:hypothetical protein
MLSAIRFATNSTCAKLNFIPQVSWINRSPDHGLNFFLAPKNAAFEALLLLRKQSGRQTGAVVEDATRASAKGRLAVD